MAVIPTGAIFHKLVFGSVDSSDYGIYITGEAVYNAPNRAVSMVTVPGRNGALALDQGRWENIEVTYPAGCFADSEGDFRDAISAFRNAVVSQIGYQRLTDTYNPNEYRMGVYLSGLDVKPTNINKAGEFDITFNCKPQRWLTNGETEITVDSGDTVTNPTQYGSSPLLAIEGYGSIDIGGQIITVDNSPLGNVTLANNKLTPQQTGDGKRHTITTTFSTSAFNTDDVETLNGVTVNIRLDATNGGGSDAKFTSVTFTSPVGSGGTFKFNASITGQNTRYLTLTLNAAVNPTFAVGTAYASVTSYFDIEYSKSWTGGSSTGDVTGEFTISKSVSGENETLTLSVLTYGTGTQSMITSLACGTLTGYSTVTLLGHPTYIDCDLGECYKIESGEYISLNGKIALGSDLPELASGSNAITYDNTITELKVVPRWWRL